MFYSILLRYHAIISNIVFYSRTYLTLKDQLPRQAHKSSFISDKKAQVPFDKGPTAIVSYVWNEPCKTI